MERLYKSVIANHLTNYRQMIFLAGARQVGKTTATLEFESCSSGFHYLNWDVLDHRQLIIGSIQNLASFLKLDHLKNSAQQLPIVVFDEIHKFSNWKNFLKGFFDLYGRKIKILVTGSARLNIYQSGGDSLMGRYFLYRMHPLSVAELLHTELSEELIRKPSPLSPEKFEALSHYGGFPEPYSMANESFVRNWRRLRHQQLFREDLRDLTKIQDVGRIELLAELLSHQTGQLTTFSSLSKKMQVTAVTAKNWISILESIYYCYSVTPWSKNVSRSLLKEPKYYLWNWGAIVDPGARVENMIASHLLKAVHLWSDLGKGDFGLHFLRNKEQREVDFVITRDGKPWFLVEVKKSKNKGISSSLLHFHKELKTDHAFQVVFDMDYIDGDCFTSSEPVVVPATTFLSQLI